MSHLDVHRSRVGRKIKRARKAKGFSLDTFAAQVNTTKRHLMRIERGDHLPREALLGRIAEATGHDVSWFESEDDEEPDPVALMAALMERVIDQRVEKRLKAIGAGA